MQPTADCGYSHLRRSRGGRGEQGIVVDHPSGNQDDEGHLYRLVDMRVATWGVGAGGRAGEEGEGVRDGEGGCDS